MKNRRHGYFRLLIFLVLSVNGHSNAELQKAASDVLLVTQFDAYSLAYVDPENGITASVEVGRAPYSVATSIDGRAYVTTGEGLAVVDIHTQKRIALVPYQTSLSGPQWGEYRQGGMGVAVSPDGQIVAVGINRGEQPGQLELKSTQSLRTLISVPVGIRPFDVVFGKNGQEVYSIDHDSYSVTALDIESAAVRVFDAAPLGQGAFDKPHYAAINPQGHLLMPIQGRVLVTINPQSGKSVERRLSANTHQHGVALSNDGQSLFVVGTGPAGGARGQPQLSQIDLIGNNETHIDLHREHEQIALSSDGLTAYISGGNSYTGGWNGISVVDLRTKNIRRIEVPKQPLGIAVWKNPDN